MRPDRVRGFTLLEAVVALAILAAAGMALFAAMSQAVQMTARAERVREDDVALRNALAWIEQVNPTAKPDGDVPLGGYELRWRAALVEPVLPGATGYLLPGYYEVGLYDLDLELWRDGELRREARLRRAGYRQVRKPEFL